MCLLHCYSECNSYRHCDYLERAFEIQKCEYGNVLPTKEEGFFKREQVLKG